VGSNGILECKFNFCRKARTVHPAGSSKPLHTGVVVVVVVAVTVVVLVTVADEVVVLDAVVVVVVPMQDPHSTGHRALASAPKMVELQTVLSLPQSVGSGSPLQTFSVWTEFTVPTVKRIEHPERNTIGHTYARALSEHAWGTNGILECATFCQKTRTARASWWSRWWWWCSLWWL
jgi:hypothetical protein